MAVTRDQLSDYAREYSRANAEAKRLKARMDQLKEKLFSGITQLTGSDGKGGINVPGFQVIREERVASNFNQEKTLERVKELGAKDERILGIIIKVEQVDLDGLQNIVNSGLLKPADFDGCIDEKKTYALKVKEETD